MGIVIAVSLIDIALIWAGATTPTSRWIITSSCTTSASSRCSYNLQENDMAQPITWKTFTLNKSMIYLAYTIGLHLQHTEQWNPEHCIETIDSSGYHSSWTLAHRKDYWHHHECYESHAAFLNFKILVHIPVLPKPGINVTDQRVQNLNQHSTYLASVRVNFDIVVFFSGIEPHAHKRRFIKLLS